MRNYLVFIPNGQKAIEENFPKHHKIGQNLWAVASKQTVSSDVCDTLGIDNPRTMVVVPMDEYYGRFDGVLWEKLEAWSRS